MSIQLFRERLSNWKASKRTRQYRKAWWVGVVHCCIVKFTSFQRDRRRCYEYLFVCVKRNRMDSELLTCLFKIYRVFPRLPFGIVAYAFTLFLDNLCRNSCIPESTSGQGVEDSIIETASNDRDEFQKYVRILNPYVLLKQTSMQLTLEMTNRPMMGATDWLMSAQVLQNRSVTYFEQLWLRFGWATPFTIIWSWNPWSFCMVNF